MKKIEVQIYDRHHKFSKRSRLIAHFSAKFTIGDNQNETLVLPSEGGAVKILALGSALR